MSGLGKLLQPVFRNANGAKQLKTSPTRLFTKICGASPGCLTRLERPSSQRYAAAVAQFSTSGQRGQSGDQAGAKSRGREAAWIAALTGSAGW